MSIADEWCFSEWIQLRMVRVTRDLLRNVLRCVAGTIITSFVSQSRRLLFYRCGLSNLTSYEVELRQICITCSLSLRPTNEIYFIPYILLKYIATFTLRILYNTCNQFCKPCTRGFLVKLVL